MRRDDRARALQYTSDLIKTLERLERKHCGQVSFRILELAHNPVPHDSRELRDYAPYRRVDIGEYRIIYRFDETTVYVAAAGKRNDSEIYRFLKHHK
jgi:mRNA interferase RelE/StbE